MFANLRALLSRMRNSFRGPSLDRDLEVEMASHLQFAIEDNLKSGMSQKEAQRQAQLSFGGPQQSKEAHRDSRGLPFLDSVLQDLRFAFRLFRKAPSFSVSAILTLALGIGATTAIFSVVYATLLSPMPYPNPDQLVIVWSKVNGDRNGVSAGDFLDWKRQSTVFQSLCAWTGGNFALASSDHPEMIQTRVTTPGFNDMVGTPFFMGRDFLPEEGQVGREHVVVMTHRLWMERFGSDREIIGKPIRLNGEPYTVVGVLATGQPDRLEAQLFVPLAFKPEQINHDFHFVLVMGRLRPGVTIEQANADMDSVTRHIAEVYPKSNKGWGAAVELGWGLGRQPLSLAPTLRIEKTEPGFSIVIRNA